MNSIGFRCWNDRISFVVLGGTQEDPKVFTRGHVQAPASYNRSDVLVWLRQEIHEILNKNSVNIGFFKAIENNSRNKDTSRAEFEGVLQEAARSHNCKINIQSRLNSQIKRDLAFENPARYLKKRFPSPELNELNNDKYSEACLAALCGLPSREAEEHA